MSSSDLTKDMEPVVRDKSCDKNLNSGVKEQAANCSTTTTAKLNKIQPKAANKSFVSAERATVVVHEKTKMKEKIVRVKKKFDVMNKKFNQLKCAESRKDNRQESRTRSTSERSLRSGSSARELQRSISASISTTTSVASLEAVEINIDEKVYNDGSRSATKKRLRNKKNSREYQFIMPPSQICREMNLNAETLLILDLLALPEDSRGEFLMRLAIEKCIFVENPESHAFELNPKLRKLESVLNNNQVNLRDYIRRHKELSEQKSGKKEQKDPKEKVKRLFEEYVNSIVQEGLTDEQKLEFEFPLTPAKQRTKNYFYSNPFTERLEAFAQRCVEAQLGVIVEGEVRINAKNNEQAFVNNGESDAMFPSQIVRKCALQGDIVRAFIRVKSGSDSKDNTVDLNASSDAVPEEELDPQEIIPERSAKGFVIKIVEEVHNRECVGSFLSYRLDSEHIMFVPRDMKMPNIKVYRENWPEFIKGNMEKIQDDLYMAKIVGWSGEICVGKILQSVGKCGELDSENSAILLENGLNINPYDDSISELFYGPIRLSEEERAQREDLRSECIFTIDPLTARDLDDAMSCKTLPNGNYEIGVHISDVTHFVEEDSILDKMIQNRTTSVYMVNEVFHMLPKSLCLKCSLLPGEEKLTFSVFWEFTPEGEVLNTRFCRSVINSCVQFAYEHAQKIIDNPERDFSETDFPMIHNGFTVEDIVEKVKVLQKISKILREKRFDNGAIRINRPKLHFELDPKSGAPIKCEVYKLDTANFLIEEFMLLANQSVAKFIYEKFPDVAFLRQHDPPKSRLLQELKNRLSALGLELDISSSKSLYHSFGKIIAESGNPLAMEIALSHMVSKCMTRALYFCSGIKGSEDEFKHYALSIPIYTHFTSPIRRYPDVLVHRVLSAALGYSSPPRRSTKELQKLAGKCNSDKYSAKLAGDDSSQLYFVHYIKSKKTVVVPAVVLCINKWSFEVVLMETGHVLQVQYPKKKSNINITANTTTKPPTAQMVNKNVPDAVPTELRIFSEISVEIYEEKNKIKARLPEPPSPSSDPKNKSAKNSGEQASEQELDNNEKVNLPDNQKNSICESIEETPADNADKEPSSSSSDSSEFDQELNEITLQSGLEVTQSKIAPIIESLEQDFSQLQIPSGCPEVEVVAK